VTLWEKMTDVPDGALYALGVVVVALVAIPVAGLVRVGLAVYRSVKR
jgi:hypothetical protein